MLFCYICSDLQGKLESDWAAKNPVGALFLVFLYWKGSAASTKRQYTSVMGIFFRYWASQGKSQEDIKVPFSEIILCGYFINCAAFRNGRGGTGLKLATINSHLSQLKSYCKRREAPILISPTPF